MSDKAKDGEIISKEQMGAERAAAFLQDAFGREVEKLQRQMDMSLFYGCRVEIKDKPEVSDANQTT